jgi:phage terminase small subunit
MSNVRLLPTPAPCLEEPEWSRLIPDANRRPAGSNLRWRDLASSYWHSLTVALAPYGTIGTENGHALMRLVVAYVRFDRATAELHRGGLITSAPKTGTAKANIWRTEQRAAADTALALEGELGISPRRRGSAKKAGRPARGSSKADEYLNPDRGA